MGVLSKTSWRKHTNTGRKQKRTRHQDVVLTSFAFFLYPVNAKQKQDVLNQVSKHSVGVHDLWFSVSTCTNIVHNNTAPHSFLSDHWVILRSYHLLKSQPVFFVCLPCYECLVLSGLFFSVHVHSLICCNFHCDMFIKVLNIVTYVSKQKN